MYVIIVCLLFVMVVFVIGIWVNGSCLIIGSISVANYLTCGITGILLVPMYWTTSIITILLGSVVVNSVVDTSFNNIIEDSFMYELIQRGYNMIKDKTFYIFI